MATGGMNPDENPDPDADQKETLNLPRELLRAAGISSTDPLTVAEDRAVPQVCAPLVERAGSPGSRSRPCGARSPVARPHVPGVRLLEKTKTENPNRCRTVR